MGEAGPGDAVETEYVQQAARGRGSMDWSQARQSSGSFHLCHWPIAWPTAKFISPLLSCLSSHVAISSSCIARHLRHSGTVLSPQELCPGWCVLVSWREGRWCDIEVSAILVVYSACLYFHHEFISFSCCRGGLVLLARLHVLARADELHSPFSPQGSDSTRQIAQLWGSVESRNGSVLS